MDRREKDQKEKDQKEKDQKEKDWKDTDRKKMNRKEMDRREMNQIERNQANNMQESGERRKMQRRNSVILIVALLAAFLLFYMIQKMTAPDSGLNAVIQIDGETVHTMDLDVDAEYTAGDLDGDYNIVVVKDGSVSVREADCANQVCVKTGQIRYPGEVIACLPHKLIIYIQ